MQCQDVRQMLDAWVDSELPGEQSARLNRHLEICGACAAEADAHRLLVATLDAMPAVPVPTRLAPNTIKKFRASLKPPSITEWWRGLGFFMRSAACGAAMAGLLLGIILGSSLSALPTTAGEYIEALYHTEGMLP